MGLTTLLLKDGGWRARRRSLFQANKILFSSKLKQNFITNLYVHYFFIKISKSKAQGLSIKINTRQAANSYATSDEKQHSL